MKARCSQCKQPHEFAENRRGPGWRVCPACRDAKRRAAKAAWKRKHRAKLRATHPVPRAARHGVTSHRKVAAAVGLRPTRVLEIERAVLGKIRAEHPELLELYRNWVAEGSPKPARLGDAGLLILGFQAQILDWYAFVLELQENGLTAEAGAVEDLIEECQVLLAREIRNGVGYPVGTPLGVSRSESESKSKSKSESGSKRNDHA